MGIINTERFVEMYSKSKPVVLNAAGTSIQNYGSGIIGQVLASCPPTIKNVRPFTNIDRESALQAFEYIRTYIKDNGWVGGKGLRPWFLDGELYKNLDRAEPWWGFEFETGYKSKDARSMVIDHCWDNFEGIAFDSEGEGNAAVEITFAPQERSKFIDGTAQALRFTQFLDANPKLINKTDNANVGTHINMSHPDLNADNLQSVCHGLTRTVGTLPRIVDGEGDIRRKFFGRARLYGGFNAQQQNGSIWIEGKLFRTTYKLAEFQRYVRVCHALTDSMDAIIRELNNADNTWQRTLQLRPYVFNLYEMVEDGAPPQIAWARTVPNGPKKPRQVNVNDGGCRDENFSFDAPQTKEEAEAEARAEEERQRLERIAKVEAERKRREEEAAEEARAAAARAMHAEGKRPKGIPAEWVFCDDCADWHED